MKFAATAVALAVPAAAIYVNSTTTEENVIGTTVITVPCLEAKCTGSETEVTTGFVVVTDNVQKTIYTTYCPLPSEGPAPAPGPSSAEGESKPAPEGESKPAPTGPEGTVYETNIQTTRVTITSCEDNKCNEVEVETGLTTVTDNEKKTVYVTYCPLPSTQPEQPPAPAPSQSPAPAPSQPPAPAPTTESKPPAPAPAPSTQPEQPPAPAPSTQPEQPPAPAPTTAAEESKPPAPAPAPTTEESQAPAPSPNTTLAEELRPAPSGQPAPSVSIPGVETANGASGAGLPMLVAGAAIFLNLL